MKRWPMNTWIGLALGGLGLLAMATYGYQTSWPAQDRATWAVMSLANPGSICLLGQPNSTFGFFVLLTTGLLTGLSHCVGMCGPLVGAFALRRRAERLELSTPLALFQMGRLTTYMLLGAGLGTMGQALATVIHNWQGLLAIIVGLWLALAGLSLWGLLPLQRRLTSIALTRTVGVWLRQLMTSKRPLAPFGLGLANGLLPCGPVYAMLLMVALSGGPLPGALIMLIFGLGTLPAMLGVGLSVSLLSVRVRTGLYRLAATLIILVGLQLALRGLAWHGQVAHAAIGSVMLW